MNIKALLKTLTLEEKAGQLTQLPPFFFHPDALKEVAGPIQRLQLSEDDIFVAGSVLGVGSPEEMMTIQSKYLEKSRHKIPLMFMADIIHGYKTIFPIPLALAGSFSPDNFYQMARASAIEATSSGIHVTFAPMADLTKDPRWGRVMESYGEDPYLAYQYAFAATKGYQGASLKNVTSLAATAKHFAAYGAALAGRDYAQAHVSLHDFYQQYDAGYRGAIDAGAKLTMTAFNVFEGIPATINKSLIKGVLRKRLGFKGVVISDYDSIIESVVHRVSKDDQDAVRQALLASVDIEMASGAYIKHIPTLVRTGLIDEGVLDKAVFRVLKLKRDLGLFKNPFKGANINKEKSVPLSTRQKTIAKRLADESIVLLKNDQNILPLSNQKVALLGKMSQTGALLGPWSWHGRRDITASVRSRFPRSKLIASSSIEDVDKWDKATLNEVKSSEVIVVVSGEDEHESGEARSKAHPILDGQTVAFIRQLQQFNIPIVLVLTAGRPLVLTSIINQVNSIVYAYFLGTETAASIVDTLFGINNPSAKLTMSFPRHVGQIPLSYNYLNTGRPFANQKPSYTSHYIDESNKPLFPFGHGLSYSHFSYTDMQDVSTSEQLAVQVTVTNDSDRAGFAITPLYMQALLAPVALPNRQLVAINKTWLVAQEKRIVTIKLDWQWLSYIDENYRRTRLKGKIALTLSLDDEGPTLTKELS